ncbi:MAG: M1 family metallopeptidase [Candidatus Nomurabacteria bacterium]|jgi:aminopeptidase N|nr:M1 family metallopeptidase [Candidatus Nomurabacteria bacterium]
MKKSVNQLSEWFAPKEYFLELSARPESKIFVGTVEIWGQKKREFVRLHVKGLKIKDVTFLDKTGEYSCEIVQLENDEIELRPTDKISDFEEISLPDNGYWERFMRREDYYETETGVRLEFDGQIIDGQMHGLYPCRYQIDGEDKTLLATQFESHHAREVFPCVDEPAAKAVFNVTVNTDPKVTVLGNMPIAEQNVVTPQTDDATHNEPYQNEPYQSVKFQPTPKMSTYLLALVIGDLHKKTAKTKGGVEVNVYATPAQPADSLDFALDVATRTIDYYDEYFGVKYPLLKSDHVAIPDFSAGAMENWGLVTYRETCLLVGKNAGLEYKQGVATVIAHELSHQWFGNLVTMKWWNDLWLNESFASLMEHVTIDKLFPDWNIWANAELSESTISLRRDALNGVQSVRQEVNHPDEISTLFDPAIVYAKGERLLTMLRAYIGEEAFRAGLQSYFEKYKYSNTTVQDLLEEMSVAHNNFMSSSDLLRGSMDYPNESGNDDSFNLENLMMPWLTQSGFPAVFVSRNGDEITLRQERFFSGKNSHIEDFIYPIPLFSNDENAPKILDQKTVTFTAKNPDDFQLNVGNVAHFIAVYDEDLTAKICDKIPQMPAVDRAKFLNELLLEVMPNLKSTAVILDVLMAYKNENDETVWEVISLALAMIDRFVKSDSDDEKRLKKLAGELAQKEYLRLGWKIKKDESANDQKLRSTIISQMIYAENREAIDEALQIYGTNKHDLSAIDGDLRATIFRTAVIYGDADEFAYLLDIYKTSQDADLKDDICSALTATRSQDNIDETLGFLDKLNIIKPQDMSRWFVYLLSNRRARAKTWRWLRENWAWIEKTFGDDKSYDVFPRYAGTKLSTREELSEYDEFFADKLENPALKRAIEVGHNDIAARVDWLDRDRAEVLKKLENIVK